MRRSRRGIQVESALGVERCAFKEAKYIVFFCVFCYKFGVVSRPTHIIRAVHKTLFNMHFLRMLAYAIICTPTACANENNNIKMAGLSIKDGDQHWDENAAKYLQDLISKHGAKVEQERELFRQECVNSQIVKESERDESRLWHVGEAAVEKFDETISAVVMGKLREIWPKSISIRNWHLSDVGLFILSIGDTDIFDDL